MNSTSNSLTLLGRAKSFSKASVAGHLDPACVTRTGTVEIRGLTTVQALGIVRG